MHPFTAGVVRASTRHLGPIKRWLTRRSISLAAALERADRLDHRQR